MEEGMSYYIDQDGTEYIFRYEKLSSNKDNVVGNDIIGVNGSTLAKFDSSTEITVKTYKIRRATVEEDVWLEESKRAGTRLTKEEAIANFDKKYK